MYRVCSVINCPSTSYQRPCNITQDTACVPYTQCIPGVTTLRNRGFYSDGVCLPCTNCSASRLTLIGNCTQYADTVCGGGACSGASPCADLVDRNSYCDFTALGLARANLTTLGACGTCPAGYSSNGLECFACPNVAVRFD